MKQSLSYPSFETKAQNRPLHVDHHLVKYGLADISGKKTLHSGRGTQEIAPENAVQSQEFIPLLVKERNIMHSHASFPEDQVAARQGGNDETIHLESRHLHHSSNSTQGKAKIRLDQRLAVFIGEAQSRRLPD